MTNQNNSIRFVKQLGNDPLYKKNWNVDMSEDLITIVEIFYYYDDKGRKLYTSNEVFANVRAKFYGTEKVFVENV